MSNEQPCRICGASWGEFGCACQSPAGTGDEPGNYRDWSGAAPVAPLIPAPKPIGEIVGTDLGLTINWRLGTPPAHGTKLYAAPPAVTAAPPEPRAIKPTPHPNADIEAAVAGLVAPVEQASRSIAPKSDSGRLLPDADKFVDLMRAWRFANVGGESERTFAAVVAHVDQWAASIPPQQPSDPIYLIRPKAGGPTWTECISEQSYDAAMQLGVYESRVVVEVGAADGGVRDAINAIPSKMWWHADGYPVFNNMNGDDLILRQDVIAAIAKEKAS